MMKPPTELEQKLLALSPKPPALIGLVMSSWVVVYILRNPVRKKRIYHRLVLVMSCYGILFSIILLLGTLLAPSGTPYIYGASGTVATCTLAGIITQISLAVPLYYSSLSIYCYYAIKADFKDELILWIEPWIHGVINSFIIGSSFIIAVTNSMNPSGSVCWCATYPTMCGPGTGKQCERGNPKLTRLFRFFLIALPIYVAFALSGFMMVEVYRFQKKLSLKNCQGKKRVLVKAQKQKTRLIAIQGSLYFAAYAVSFTIPIIQRSMILFFNKPIYPLWIIGIILAAMQNTLFALVYFCTLNQRPRTPFQDSHCISLRRRLSENSQIKERDTNEVTEVSSRRRSFSIFDGTQATGTSSPWSAFLIDDDSDDYSDEEGKKENENVIEPCVSVYVDTDTINNSQIESNIISLEEKPNTAPKLRGSVDLST